MKTEKIVELLNDKRGQSLNVRLVSSVECLAAENRKDIREAIEAGERGEVQALPWGQWKQFPHVIEHKGKDYIRLYLPSKAQQDAGFGKVTVSFLCNGQPISREQAIVLCGSKAQAKENEQGCMTVKAENLAIV